MAKKTVAVCSILLLVLGLLPSVNADIVKSDPDGVAYDNFNEGNDITLVGGNCTLENGSIILTNGTTNATYDYSETPNKIEAWKYRETLAHPGEEGMIGVLGRLVNPTLIPNGEEFDASDYNNIKAEEDGLWVETQSVYGWIIDHTYYPINRFKFQINQTKDSVKNLKIHWRSGEFDDSANLKNISMYIWSYGDIIPRWESFGGTTSESNGSIDANDESNKFISDGGEIEILIIGTPEVDGDENTCTLYSDYIRVTITTKGGYLPEGTVISSIIEPGGSFSGWESIIWDSSKPTDKCYIKLQVLDYNNNIIGTLDGNSDGFTDSPIDLSSLDPSYTKIKLKATLYSSDLQFTPYLYSWGVLWHTSGGFHDSFMSDFRISKTYSVEIESGDVKISDFAGNWPIFGKDPANTRAYVGPEAGVGSNKTYWFTHRNTDTGGWFRSPIMNNGRVYIGSNYDKIYAFNLTANSVGDAQNPVDASDAEYKVETSVAANDDIVIVATGKLDSRTNKIYALNSTNLSYVEWFYPAADYDDPICFSASPTISDGKVFVTSWSGRFWNTPFAYYLFNRLNSILGYRLGLNNKLIGLDLNTHNEIWDPIDLPAGSFSTPAVANGLIFVGCENLQGPSLFAFNENTGKTVWNASVGAIGKASPVVTESDTGKVVIVLSREQSILSFKGTDKVVALNAETGEILWNKTIGNESSLLRTVLLKSRGFEHTMAISPPAATPAVFGDTVFVMSSDGKLHAFDVNSGDEKWTFDVTKETQGISSSYFTASPIVVDNNVYVTSTDGYIYILDTSNGELIRDIYPFEYSDYRIPPPTYVYASPIITNGLILLSAIELNPVASTTVGRVFCIGEYTNNSFGEIYSVPIHVQKGKWWSSFNAHYDNTTENTVTFSILDGNGNIVKSNLNGTNNNISDLKSGIIQLCAKLRINNASQAPPVLKDWEVLWNTETSAPVFKRDSFEPDLGGWINNNTPVCTIKVSDIRPGLDVSSARFRITYTSNNKSDWYVADCSGENGTKVDETVTADISKLNLDPNASDLKSIEFSIKDLAGNKATFDLGKNFSIDRLIPTSEIVTTLSGCYTESVYIEAEGNDPGEANNKSGINTIALYYRSEGEENWTEYGSEQSPFEWEFEQDVSGVYEVCTVATDKASNREDFPADDSEVNSFTFDMNRPSKPEFKDLYEKGTIPEFTIEFKDDYQLKTVEYKIINFQADWTKINDEDINSKTYTGTWSLTKEDWAYMEDNQTYYLYFRLNDSCGNQYKTPSNDDALAILVDTIPPGANVSLDLSDLQGGGWKDTFTITADVPYDDDIAGVTLEYSYSSDNTEWSEWKQYGDNLTEEPYTWEFKAGDGSGYYRFKTKIWDASGIFNESPVQEVNLTQFPTALVALMIILFVILLVVTIILIKKMRKK